MYIISAMNCVVTSVHVAMQLKIHISDNRLLRKLATLVHSLYIV